ncbi:RHS repeat-associated protein [Flavobacterium arsenatis]|uniref:RHS repeat-associated protein n=2 Tax=Flavobacterium arsenatis TaxID=1484332 RepID=A0ABU1TTN6_9FLAO|nr:RHS repeat-associated protein [Flavobacterium arsenatis]
MAEQYPDSYYKTPFKFSGKEMDEETGLHYFGARYYDSRTSIWLSVDPLAEEFPNWNPYNYTMQNPINLVDPDGRSASPPDDHFDANGKFLYTDFRATNNIIIHGNTNVGLNNDEVKLSDYNFNKDNYKVLSNILKHYSTEAGVDLNKLYKNDFSFADEIITGHKGGQPVGRVELYNEGNYSPTDLYARTPLMTTNNEESKVTVQLKDGKVNSILNDKFNLISALDHEGGPIGHLLNPQKRHSDIYKEQIKKYAKTVTEDFNKLLNKNYHDYKKIGE